MYWQSHGQLNFVIVVFSHLNEIDLGKWGINPASVLSVLHIAICLNAFTKFQYMVKLYTYFFYNVCNFCFDVFQFGREWKVVWNIFKQHKIAFVKVRTKRVITKPFWKKFNGVLKAIDLHKIFYQKVKGNQFLLFLCLVNIYYLLPREWY